MTAYVRGIWAACNSSVFTCLALLDISHTSRNACRTLLNASSYSRNSTILDASNLLVPKLHTCADDLQIWITVNDFVSIRTY
jgi:hypothetical protein